MNKLKSQDQNSNQTKRQRSRFDCVVIKFWHGGSMRRPITEEKKICDKCGKELKGWEDRIASGEFGIMHSGTIGDAFSEGAGLKDLAAQRIYFEEHTAVKFGKMPHQSIILKYGGDAEYHLCWACNRELLKMIGSFFTMLVPKSL